MIIDQQLVCYKRLPNWTATTLPEMVTQKHNTKVGTWAKLTILSGTLHFYELDEQGEITAEHLFTPETEIPFVEPQSWHRIAAASDKMCIRDRPSTIHGMLCLLANLTIRESSYRLRGKAK